MAIFSDILGFFKFFGFLDILKFFSNILGFFIFLGFFKYFHFLGFFRIFFFRFFCFFSGNFRIFPIFSDFGDFFLFFFCVNSPSGESMFQFKKKYKNEHGQSGIIERQRIDGWPNGPMSMFAIDITRVGSVNSSTSLFRVFSI